MGEQNNYSEDDSSKNIVLTPRNTNRVWVIEEPLIDMYMVLVHRVQGIGLSLDDFWKMDTWVLSKLYLTEIMLIEKEEKEYKKGKKYNDPTEDNDPATEELYTQMFGED